MIPTHIRLSSPEQLFLRWDDGHESIISLRTLRDHCPCASCQGETIILRKYEPVPSPEMPGKYELKKAEQVGYYALQMFWGDSHATGIYAWERLRSLCECDVCRKKRGT